MPQLVNSAFFVNNLESILEQTWTYKLTNYSKSENQKIPRGK